ncbi:MAG TPA: hypothetical protein VHF06_07385 [Pseudonocardiaceae bacterium]|nr:hypothetical protein [Pseudonocardiaceae bacterium]
MRAVALRIGILLAGIGLGSAILHAFTSYQFGFLNWAEGAQPWLGLGLTVAGGALAVAARVRRERPWQGQTGQGPTGQGRAWDDSAWADSTPTVPFRRPTWPNHRH